MSESLLQNLVRNFPENGPKLLLENAANLRDLLHLVREKHVGAIDFSALTVERSHFVQPDYQHVSLDLLFKAPFRLSDAEPPESIYIYLLVEHQSKPQRFFMLRLGEYVHEVYKMQKAAWDKEHDSDAKLSLYPVIPVLLYTGERHWEDVKKLPELVKGGHLFKNMIPDFDAHFLNLRDTPKEQLVGEGGLFGQVLWLIQQRNADKAEFGQTLQAVVSKLDGMAEADRQRWVEFLSYINALVYHARSQEERKELYDIVDRSVQNDPHRKEYQQMTQTIAEMYIEKGRIEGEQKGKQEGKQEGALDEAKATLLRLLRKRFKKLPRKIEARIS